MSYYLYAYDEEGCPGYYEQWERCGMWSSVLLPGVKLYATKAEADAVAEVLTADRRGDGQLAPRVRVGEFTAYDDVPEEHDDPDYPDYYVQDDDAEPTEDKP